MREEYNSVLPTPTEADKIGCFGRYRYISKTQILADRLVYLYFSLFDNTLVLTRQHYSLVLISGIMTELAIFFRHLTPSEPGGFTFRTCMSHFISIALQLHHSPAD